LSFHSTFETEGNVARSACLMAAGTCAGVNGCDQAVVHMTTTSNRADSADFMTTLLKDRGDASRRGICLRAGPNLTAATLAGFYAHGAARETRLSVTIPPAARLK
jgi:hypothetical protein